ncbi:MAG: hypothetical protein JWS12_695 [Candidatus Saccharibacteria bacterium]|nr:hypothetical protein [Candidatus Saccharibacteria bacterium]
MESTTLQETKSELEVLFWQLVPVAETLYGNLEYHGFAHPLHVFETAWQIADECEENGLSVNRKTLLAMVLFHDAGFQDWDESQFSSREAYAAFLTGSILPDFGYTDEEIIEVQAGIAATELGIKPASLEAKIMRRADLFGIQNYQTLLEGSYKLLQESCKLGGDFPSRDQIAKAKAFGIDILGKYLEDDEPLHAGDVDPVTGKSKYYMKAKLALAQMKSEQVTVLEMRYKDIAARLAAQRRTFLINS